LPNIIPSARESIGVSSSTPVLASRWCPCPIQVYFRVKFLFELFLVLGLTDYIANISGKKMWFLPNCLKRRSSDTHSEEIRYYWDYSLCGVWLNANHICKSLACKLNWKLNNILQSSTLT
jgi:hypothetical protein